MKSVCIGLWAIFAITKTLPVNNEYEAFFSTDENGRNSLLESAVIDALENFRLTMVTGSGDIPILEPFHQDHIILDDSVIPVPGAHVEINNLTVSNLSTFEINTVSISVASVILQRYHVELDVEVPIIDVDIEKYDLSLNVNGMNLFGNGDAKIGIVKPRVKIQLLVGLRPRIGIYLVVLNTRIGFSIGDIQPEISGMFNDPSVDSIVNLFLKNLVLEALESFSEEITEAVSPIVQNVANDILDDINLIDILG